ncbi:hypothetical protein [Actinomadura rupiterrae]|uniref:hypothetical protein n=1 Tax=Actinomadura rupiterrae TaxID=559627 RepID=UPI0020A3CA25|nr:hypothetical protein [Actinomadura rupiterrae]MCP2342506.1 hypothetical protein [Actinomadura rupiterrae]
MIMLDGERRDLAGQGRDQGWTARTAPIAAVWVTLYGLLRVYWNLGHMPAHMSPVDTDLVAFTGWGSVALCAAAALAALALITVPESTGLRRRGLLAFGWAAGGAMVASSALFLLDVVGALAPGLGIKFFFVGSLSRAACLGGGVLLVLATLSYQRRTRSGCPRCGRSGETHRPDRIPTRAFWAAYLAVAGCLARIVAQYCVGFGESPLHTAAAVEFEIGFVLGGTLLPLALVHSFGRIWPRWVPFLAGRRVPRRLVLWPGAAISGGLVVYFGLMLVEMVVQRAQGHNPFPESDGPKGLHLPESFFWVAVPSYWIWGVGMACASIAYYRLTRPGCRRCGR